MRSIKRSPSASPALARESPELEQKTLLSLAFTTATDYLGRTVITTLFIYRYPLMNLGFVHLFSCSHGVLSEVSRRRPLRRDRI